MKLISLNCWGGRACERLLTFLDTHAKSTDLFCFQEVLDDAHGIKPEIIEAKRISAAGRPEDPELYPKLRTVLHDFDSLLAPSFTSGGERTAIFYKRNLKIKADGAISTSKPLNVNAYGTTLTVGSGIQHVEIDGFMIANFHGLWQGDKGKEDTPERFYQSQKIVQFLSKVDSKKVLVGDFNLVPKGKSIKMIEDSGMLNLIKTNNIESTRSSLYPRAHKGKFADYVFVSKEVKVNEFKVLTDEVSDHLPLYLDFS